MINLQIWVCSYSQLSAIFTPKNYEKYPCFSRKSSMSFVFIFYFFIFLFTFWVYHGDCKKTKPKFCAGIVAIMIRTVTFKTYGYDHLERICRDVLPGEAYLVVDTTPSQWIHVHVGDLSCMRSSFDY